ncbi:MAG TPA: ferritin-like domain-containing protein [Prosthecobacter sp.]
MKLNSLTDLFQHEIKDLYSAEKQLVKALPKMAKAATNAELAAGFEAHLAETQEHVNRLEQISTDLGFSLGRHKCKAMEGLIEEGADLIAEDAQENVRDAGLIGAAQRVEHYEIAGYGTARTLALQLDLKAAAELLSLTLEEEKATDVKLSKLAANTVNVEAAQTEEESSEE